VCSSDLFGIDLFISDIPEGSFVNKLTEGMAEDLHRHYIHATETLLAQTQAEQIERLVDVMKSLSHCCDIEIKEGKDGETKVYGVGCTSPRYRRHCSTARHLNLLTRLTTLALMRSAQGWNVRCRG
jgi:hypothetical protein